jgi:hypothetical protein
LAVARSCSEESLGMGRRLPTSRTMRCPSGSDRTGLAAEVGRELLGVAGGHGGGHVGVPP